METLVELLASRSPDIRDQDGDSQAFTLAAERSAALAASVTSARHPRPRVAVLLPQGAEFAGALVGVMCVGTVVPLSPRITPDDVTFTLRDAEVDMLVTDTGSPRAAAACTAARQLAIPVRSLTEAAPIAHVDILPDDLALLLHTSGTTARPKLVPLTHGNLLSSAAAVASALGLSHSDHGVAVMPLFHIHGIVGSLLASLFAGATLTVIPFDPLRLQSTLALVEATWMSAVPTMYQAMMLRPPVHPAPSLRLLRSSSSTLPLATWRALQDRFGCTVVNSYGMTEAAHQMCSTGVVADPSEFGSVGRAAGPEVAILRDGVVTNHGDGEVIIRGTSVTAGYLSPADANSDAFIGGWFRTGDSATLTDDGRLTLRGRLKELINVGGEKVSPFEIDDALLSHPSVVEAVAFAAPESLLGEVVHAAVTVCADVDEATLQRHARDRLAKFKVPVRIHVVSEIPKGPTGKVQRIHLASQLGINAAS